MNNPNGFYCFDKKEFSESFFNGMLQMLSSERNKREKEWERERERVCMWKDIFTFVYSKEHKERL